MWSAVQSVLALIYTALPSSLVPSNGPVPRPVVFHDAPFANGGNWADAFALASEVVAKMTVEEKVNITSAVDGPCPSNSGGVPRLGIPGMCFDDGPAGPRYTDFITQFPSTFTAAASFDRELMYERGAQIGKEFRGKGINVALAPVTGGPLGRSPFGGRNWEAFTPEPYLSAVFSGITVRAMQESGLITCAKHYILYEQDALCTGPIIDGLRTGCEYTSAEVDDKTVKELYLPSFVESVRAGTGAIMCSYNKINGTQGCENSDTMNRIMKDELNFQGFILSDYGATHSTVPSALAGMDMELPSVAYYGNHLLDAVRDGHVSIPRLDDMARRILTVWYAANQHKSYPETNWQMYNLADETEVNGQVFRNQHVDNRGDSHLLARKVAAESTVLLKNDGVLPIQGVRRIGVFGSDADVPPTLSGCGPDLFCIIGSDRRYWAGTVTVGGGSGAAYADYISSPIEAISLRARGEKIRVDQLLKDDPAYYGSISNVAAASEVCMVFVSVYSVEGWDRETLRLDKAGEELIKTVERGCAGKVVVVMHTAGPVIMEDWIALPKISGVLWAGYPGQETGNAIVDVLWGDVNPSAKLPFTMGRAVPDWPTGNIVRETGVENRFPRAVFTERLAIDHRWFDLHEIDPRFEFGFGLSYTSFEMNHLSVSDGFVEAQDAVQPTNEKFEGDADLYDALWTASVNVTNTGELAGAEIPQLYMSFPESEVDQPPRLLKGFDKVYLEAGKSRTIEFPLRKKDLSIWDVERQLWRIPHGTFVFRAGNSSRRLPLHVTLKIGQTP